MPIYEYRCGVCDRRVEVLVRSDGVTPVCPDCGSLLSNKLFSVPNVLKGLAQPPQGQACCGQDEPCDVTACAYGDDCRHH